MGNSAPSSSSSSVSYSNPPQTTNNNNSTTTTTTTNNNNNNSRNQSITSSTNQQSPLESPGAYNVPGQSKNQKFTVTIPKGVKPGEHFAVIVNGQQMMVRCPPGQREGERLMVTLPRRQAQQYVVTVPPNVRPGEQFRVMISNQEVMVTCPPNVRPNQRVTFTLPERPQQPTAPNHHMYEVVVPPGVRSGQPFALIAGGQRVMVTCPPNVLPGQKIRFQLPVQLSQQQFEAIKVDYDMDGWMRCLGADLKFHWVYNSSSKTSNDTHEQHKIPFDLNSQAYVRELLPPSQSKELGDIRFIEATLYAMPTTVHNTQVNYQELSSVALLPFQQKCEWIKNQFTALRVPWEEGHIKLKIRRSSILSDSYEGLESIRGEDMHKIFRFEFIGEPGLDAGGVTREWYTLISQQLFNPDLGLFLYSSANQMCLHINPNSGIANERHLKFFHFAGRVLGKALMDGQIIPVHLVQPLYKHLMGFPVTLKDLEHIDSEIYRSLNDLLDIDDISMLYLDFTVTEDQLGLQCNIPLIPGGNDILVTSDNVVEYLKEQLKYRLLGRVKEQLLEFLKGFYDVVPEPLLAVFNFQELELLLHGLPNIDMDDWQHNTDYTGEFTGVTDHKVIKWFWEIVRSYSQENRAKLLQFSTGTSGVPPQGFAYLQGNDGNIRRFTLHGDKNVKIFPRSHTCFNRIDLPIYATKAEMMKYLTLAITYESTGFGIE